MQAYCMTCRAKREMSRPKTIKTDNGKPAIQGVCPKCGTKMYRIFRDEVFILGSRRQAASNFFKPDAHENALGRNFSFFK